MPIQGTLKRKKSIGANNCIKIIYNYFNTIIKNFKIKHFGLVNDCQHNNGLNKGVKINEIISYLYVMAMVVASFAKFYLR